MTKEPATKLTEGEGSETPTVRHGALQVALAVDQALPAMLGVLWSGKHIEKMTMTCNRVAGGDCGAQGDGQPLDVPYRKVELEAVVISHLDIADDACGDAVGHAAFSYRKMTYTHTTADKGKSTVGTAIRKSHDPRTNVVA